ncbi:MAG: glycoside hydrolase family 3 C-terminal domain-containing protein [Firmicutes bacterium]|nr:glycoside hydrolase family 3 C-terminal domain-containing protein [Bacillota bacterium]
MEKWQRFRYMPVKPLGEDGRIVTGSPEHIRLSRQTAAEGMVLLKNDGGLLPLKQGRRVALFGKASADYVKGGGGSGDVTVAYVRNLCDGMEEKQAQGKLSAYLPLHSFYRENVARQRQEGLAPGYTVEPALPDALLEGAAEFADVAILSICRFSSEGWDRQGTPNDGDFYLSVPEQQLVEQVCRRFDRVVVVLNVGGVVDTSWFAHNPHIQAVLLAWQGGQEGALAEADILCGDVCPSGKLADTFAAAFADYPSSAGFQESEDHVCYTEDIFVGYRYFETIPGAAQKVNYPFGFGLSYTDFAISCESLRMEEDAFTVRAAVTNCGATAGREVVQLYTHPQGCAMDMPALELRGFAKTRLLPPGESQTLELRIPVAALAAYDESLAAYVVPEGRYEFLLGNSARSLQTVGAWQRPSTRIIRQVKNRCVPAKLPCRMISDGTYQPLPMGEYTGRTVDADWPEKAHWQAEHILPDASGIPVPDGRIDFARVAAGEVTMEAFLAQLTDEEMITLLGGTANRGVADTRGIGGLDSCGIPAVMTADGPAGLRICPDRGVTTTAWPVATLLACTWDPEQVYQVGQAAAREVKENNLGMWLAPAVNIHRSPLCGRNFEYYSEDPYLTGAMATAMVQGIQSQHISACVKHFCCNNKEGNRFASDSRVSERALREIYLKAFEMVVKDGGVWSVMTAYNLLNGTYTSENSDLLTGILREEWGYDGLVITDWDNWAEHYREALAGNNLRMPHGSPKRLQRAMAEGRITRAELLGNARRILEFLLRLD